MELDIWQIATGIPLLLCSIAALSLILDKGLFLMKQRDLSTENYETALTLIAESNVQVALEKTINAEPYYQQALVLMKKEQRFEKSLRDDQISTLMVKFTSRLRRRLSGLVTVAALAPMLGLLGTIVGLMRAFKNIGAHAGPVEPSLVANGLWQALTTTAAGLVIAIICILAHALFVSKIRNMLTRSQYLLNTISQALYQLHRNEKA